MKRGKHRKSHRLSSFARNAQKVRKINIKPFVPRGGIRL